MVLLTMLGLDGMELDVMMSIVVTSFYLRYSLIALGANHPRLIACSCLCRNSKELPHTVNRANQIMKLI